MATKLGNRTTSQGFEYLLKASTDQQVANAQTSVLSSTREEVATPVITVVKDTVGQVVNLKSGDITNDVSPTFEGTGDPGSKIIVKVGDTVIGTTFVRENGKWIFTPAELGQGLQVLSFSATNSAGFVSGTTLFGLFVDSDKPPVPTIVEVKDDAGIASILKSGDLTNDNTPTFNGEGEPGSKISIRINNREIGSAVVSENGKWTFTPTKLNDGFQTLTFTATDKAGNVSNISTFSLTVDSSAQTPSITRVTDNVGGISVISNGGATNDTTPTFSGRGEAGSRIVVTNGSTVIGSTTVLANGTWSFTPSKALPQGELTLTFTATDLAGNVSNNATFRLTVDTSLPNGGLAPVVEILTDSGSDGAGGINASTRNDGFINAAEIGNATQLNVKISFTGANVAVGDTVRLTTDGGRSFKDVSISATDKSAGFVTTTVIRRAEGSTVTVESFIVDRAGNRTATASDSATFDTTSPTAPSITNLIDNAGPVTGNLTSGSTADDATPTLTGRAEANSRVTIFDGSLLIGSVRADANGNWTFTPSGNIAGGRHEFTVRATDVAGNTSAPSSAFIYTLNQAPTFKDNNVTAAVSEDGLAGGLLDTGNSKVEVSGSMGISDPDSQTVKVTLAAPSTKITSGGVEITWSGHNSSTLIGSAGGKEIIRVSIDSTGKYDVKLSGRIDHAVNGEDTLSLKFGVTASDTALSSSGTLNVNIQDDAPIAVSQSFNATAKLDIPARANILLTIDSSMTMRNTDGIDGASRFETAKRAITELLDRYEDQGTDVRVMVVNFNGGASQLTTTWVTAEQAKQAIARVGIGHGTFDDVAISTTMSAFNAAGKLAGAQNIGYFFSDGVDPRNPMDTRDERARWESFLTSNKINEYAFSIGRGVTDAQIDRALDPVAFNGATGVNTDAIRLTSYSQLDALIDKQLKVTDTAVKGSLSTSGFGADGGYVKSIAIDDTTYTFNKNRGTLTVEGPNNSTFNATTKVLTIKTNTGSFAVDMGNGQYTFTPTLTLSLIRAFNPDTSGVNEHEVKPPPGWATYNKSGLLQVSDPTSVGLPSSFGKVLEIENREGDATVYTRINTTAGQRIILNFDYAARSGYRSGDDSAIQVLLNHEVVDVVNTRSLEVSNFNYVFVGTGEPIQIGFKSVNSNAGGGLLGNITISTTDAPFVGPNFAYTLADNDGDVSSANISFNNLVSSNNTNLIVNGSFEDTSGLTATSYGFVGNAAIPGWTDTLGRNIDIGNSPRNGLGATDGKNWLDLEATPGNNRIVQTVRDVKDGEVYRLTFTTADLANADDNTANDNTVTVLWGGNVFTTLNPADGRVNFNELLLVGGAGNGNNRLEFVGGGREDNVGVIIDDVTLTKAFYLNSTFSGDATANTIEGRGINDLIKGGAGNDSLNGGQGQDILVGGQGSDRLTGGWGVDIFRWSSTDDGNAGTPARDVITDFNSRAVSVSQGGDILDIRDLLVGENTTNLVNYLNFSKVGNDTVINISANGGYTNGVFNATKTTQQIVLEDVDLTTGQTNASIINSLLTQQKLIID